MFFPANSEFVFFSPLIWSCPGGGAFVSPFAFTRLSRLPSFFRLPGRLKRGVALSPRSSFMALGVPGSPTIFPYRKSSCCFGHLTLRRSPWGSRGQAVFPPLVEELLCFPFCHPFAFAPPRGDIHPELPPFERSGHGPALRGMFPVR